MPISPPRDGLFGHGQVRTLIVAAALFFLLGGGLSSVRAVGVDLTVRQSANIETVGVNSNIVYSIAVTNIGSVPATGAALTNPFPPGVTFISAVTTQGSCSTNATGFLRCVFGNMAVSGGATVTLTVRPISPGAKTNLVAVGSNEADALPANNQVEEIIPVLLFGSVMSNPQSIDLPELDGGPGSIYPSIINVSGLTTAVYNVSVTLHGISHSFPDDLDVLLVAPGGYGAILMSDAGGDGILSGVTLTFTDSAGQYLPDSGAGGSILSGNYRPTNFGFDDALPPPAPPGPYGITTSFFEGLNPNGAWALYVVDDLPEDAGSIGGGWSLRLTTSEPISDLGLSATGTPEPVTVGSNLTYHIVVTNQGPSAATGVTLVDELPPGLLFVSAVPSQGTCALVEGHLQCALGTLTNRGRATVTLTVQPQVGGTVVERLTVSALPYDTHLSNNEADVVTTVRPLADLALQMRAAPEPAFQAENLIYTLAGTNHGPATATAVVLTDLLPAGVTLVSASISQGTCSNNAGVLTCQIGSLAPGAGVGATFTVRSAAAGTRVNTASLSAAEADFNPGNNNATNTTTVLETANLVVQMQDQPDPVLMGQSLVYVVSVTNQGPSSATSVILSNRLPASAVVGQITSSQGSCTNENGVIQCHLGNLASGTEATLRITVLPQATGLITNLAGAVSNQGDPVPGNNMAAAVTAVLPAADLGVTLAESIDPLALGEVLRYTIRVTNHGPHSASGVMVTNALPPQTVFVSALTSQGVCTQSAAGIRCQLGQLNAGAEANLTFEIRPTSTATVTNLLTVSALEPDPVAENNTAREETTVLVAAGVFSNPSALTIPVGGAASPYPSTIFVSGVTVRVDAVTVTLSNLSHSFIDDVDILLVGPQGQNVLLLSDCGGGNNSGNLSLTFADNASGFLSDAGTLVSGRFRPTNHDPASDLFPDPAPSTPYGSTLSVFRNVDPNGVWSLFVFDDADKDGGQIAGGWVLSFATATELADVGVLMQDLPSPVGLSSNLTYAITLTNAGPSIATSVSLTDQLPAGALLTALTTSQGNCSNNLGVITCHLGALNAHSQATVTVKVQFPVLGTYTNLASVGADQIDDVIADNSALNITTVLQPIAITSHPIGQTISHGQSASLSASATGSEPVQFQWLHNGVPIPGAVSPMLMITNAQFGDGGNYVLRASNAVSTDQTDAALLVVLSPPNIQTPPQSRTNFAGSTATFTVGAVGTAPLTYQWFFNDGALALGTNTSLSIPSARITNGGPYFVRIANEYGAVTSSIVTLTVREADFGDAPQPGYATLLVSNAAYHLLIPGVRLGNLIDFEPDGRPGSTALGDDNGGSDDEDGVRFLAPLYIGQTAQVEVVASTNGFLNAWLDLNANQSWAQSGEQIFTNQSLVTGTNLLSVSIPLAATTGPSFARFRFSTVSNLTFSGPALDGEVEDYAAPIAPLADLGATVVDAPDPVSTGTPLTYTITITNRGPSRATSVTLSDLLPSGSSYVASTISRGSCSIQSGTVICTVGSMSVGESVVAMVTITHGQMGTVSNTVTVTTTEGDLFPADNVVVTATTVLAPPSITVHPEGGYYRVGSNITFSVQASGSPPLRYQWIFNGLDLPDRTNSVLVLTDLVPSLAGNYSVRVRNEAGSTISATARLVVGEPPVVLTLAATDVNTNSAVLHASINPNGWATAGWFEWGLSPAYGNVTAVQPLGSNNVAALQATLTELALGTTVHFRAVATNGFGLGAGLDQSFAPMVDPRPRITVAQQLPDGRFRLEFAVVDQERAYTVESSPDLIIWQNRGAGVPLAPDRFEFIEPAGDPQLFFRIVTP